MTNPIFQQNSSADKGVTESPKCGALHRAMSFAVVCAAVLLFSSAACAAGQSFYVDAVHGDDSWTGTADADHIDRSTTPVTGPRKTLAGVTALVTATKSKETVGDTVYVAEGDYKTDPMSTGGTSPRDFRLIMKAGMRMIGTGDRDKTLINGNSEIPVLYIATWCLVKNVTICNGSATADTSNGAAWQGGGSSKTEPISSSFVVGCVISNCVSGAATGAVAGGAAAASIRNLFVNNYSTKNATAGAVYSGYAWNCVFDKVSFPERGASSTLKAFNCTFVNCTTANAGGSLYNCLVRAKEGNNAQMYATVTSGNRSNGSNADQDCKTVQGLDKTQVDTDYMPIGGLNVGIDKGVNDNWATNCLSATDYPLVADEWGVDFLGNPRVVNDRIDCGAVEYSAEKTNVRQLAITDGKGGVTLTGAESGVTTVKSAAENITFRIARNYAPAEVDPASFCLGINVNGEFFSFTGTDADRVYEGSVVYGGTSLEIEAVYATTNNWYVNPVVGKGDDANDGYTPYRAKKTLKGAAKNALLRSGDVIHAAAGTYAEETMTDAKCGAIKNRVVVPDGVWLVADEGPERTIILGEKDDGGCGPDAVRCVAIEGNDVAYVRGFTLTGGATGTDGDAYAKSAGGGFSKGGYFIDCIVTNNHAASNAGGIYGATTIGCRFADNHSGTKATDLVSVVYGSHYNVVLDNTAANSAVAIVNGYLLDATVTVCKNLANTVVCGGANVKSCDLFSCLVSDELGGYCNPDTKTRTNVEGLAGMFDVNYRPKADTLPVDFGDNSYYPGTCPAELARTDLTGGQRVYNGTIDCGPGEFDWRGKYAKVLCGKSATVEKASPNVVAADDRKSLTIGPGAVLKLTVMTEMDGRCVFTPDGEVSVLLNGEVLESVEGGYSFAVAAGVPYALEIANAGLGSAGLARFDLPRQGVVILVR